MLVALSLTVGVGPVQAGVLELNIGNANVYTLGDFAAANASVAGAIVAGGNVTATRYAINQSNVGAYGSYALVVGGNLRYRDASLAHGSYYVAGSSVLAPDVSLTDASVSRVAPVSFTETGNHLKRLSINLSSVPRTGALVQQYGGLYLTGTGSAVDVFDISAQQLAGSEYVRLADVQAGATVILNIAGADVSATSLNGFADYNVVYNFYQARSVNVSSVALYGTLLAPLATVTGSSASIDGNVIAGAWDAGVQVNANHYFIPTDVVGFNPASTVPEPGGYAMLFAGLGLVILDAGRRRRAVRVVFDARNGAA